MTPKEKTCFYNSSCKSITFLPHIGGGGLGKGCYRNVASDLSLAAGSPVIVPLWYKPAEGEKSAFAAKL